MRTLNAQGRPKFIFDTKSARDLATPPPPFDCALNPPVAHFDCTLGDNRRATNADIGLVPNCTFGAGDAEALYEWELENGGINAITRTSKNQTITAADLDAAGWDMVTYNINITLIITTQQGCIGTVTMTINNDTFNQTISI
jgi:hypothetical protein